MSRLVSSVAVQALHHPRATRAVVRAALLLVALVTVIGCAPPRPAEAEVDRHVVPNTLSQVALENFEAVNGLDVDLHTAVQTREAVESEFTRAYGQKGHPRWFFHAFDGHNLDFVVARFEPTKTDRTRYVAQTLLRVKRSRDAERALGVAEVVHDYELGIKGVKTGMSRRDVLKLAGVAQSERSLGRSNAYDLRFETFCARFANGKVAHVLRRDQCL